MEEKRDSEAAYQHRVEGVLSITSKIVILGAGPPAGGDEDWLAVLPGWLRGGWPGSPVLALSKC